jgi:DNA-binding response OmpR family regulator
MNTQMAKPTTNHDAATAGRPILVVDDDRKIVALVRTYLEREGYRVVVAYNGREALDKAHAEPPALIVLDLMLPELDGFEAMRLIRADSNVPILMLTARSSLPERIIGLERGADDYLPKPFSPRELLARLRALLRRSRPAGAGAGAPSGRPSQKAPAAHLHRFGPFTLDTDAWRLMRDGAEVPVSSGEIALLRIFVEHPNRVLSRDGLIDRLKGYERGAFDRSIDVRVTRLRRKIEDDPAHPAYIRTVRGEGYLFHPLGPSS